MFRRRHIRSLPLLTSWLARHRGLAKAKGRRAMTRDEDVDQRSEGTLETRGCDPRAWAEVADDLHRAAGLLWDQIGASVDSPEKRRWLVSVGKIAMMLEGCALEMLAKAVYVSQHPDSVQGGRGCGPPQGHDLPILLQLIRFPLGTSVETDLIARLAAFVAWAGRYPIPKAKRTRDVVELAPGTHVSTGDRDLVAHLFDRLSLAVPEP